MNASSVGPKNRIKTAGIRIVRTLRLFPSLASAVSLLAAAVALWFSVEHQTQGATVVGPVPITLFLVTTTNDSNDGGCGDICSLRDAIQQANNTPGGSSIIFSLPGAAPWTITLNGPLPILNTYGGTQNMSISGPGADKLTINGGKAYRIFNITTTGTVSLLGVTIANGLASFASSSSADGAGILSINGATVNVTNCNFSGNFASNNGGGIYNYGNGAITLVSSTLSNNLATFGAGIYNSGTINVNSSSTLIDNSAAGDGGGIYNSGTANITDSTLTDNSVSGGGGGGGIYNNATANLTNSTLSHNFAYNTGGGIFNNSGTLSITGSTLSSNSVHNYGGGGIYNNAVVNVTNSTLSGNIAATGGGGIYNDLSGTDTFSNSTLSGNSGQSGGGIFNIGITNVINSTLFGNSASNGNGGGIQSDRGRVIVTNCTLSRNSASNGTGGGIFTLTGGGASLNAESTIIALNTATSSGPDVNGDFISGGFNLIGKKDGSSGFTAATDLTGTVASPLDPKLDTKGLQDNGGPTDTVALFSGSPAIDRGTSNGLTGKLTTDQRGVGYARTINKAVANATGSDGTDIGAFELGAQIKAVSRKVHGTAGPFNVNLPVTGSKVGVECRKGGSTHVFTVILIFPVAVTVSSVSVTPDPKAVGATASVSSASVSGSQVTVNLTGVSNAQTVLVNLFGVSDGTNTNDVSVPMGVLLGDTNKDRSVTSNDVTLTQSKIGQTLSTTNFREDVDLNGSINSTDVQTVQSKVGTKLP
jgi:CSLREA domain-containing protein